MNNKGFTIIEIVCVLVIIGLLSAVAVPKFIDLVPNAEIHLSRAVITEINAREHIAYLSWKISGDTPIMNKKGTNVKKKHRYDAGGDYYADIQGAEFTTATNGLKASLKFDGGGEYPVVMTKLVKDAYRAGDGPKIWRLK